jgi:hypothetical protein
MAIILPVAPTIPASAADDIRYAIENCLATVASLRGVVDPGTYTPVAGQAPFSSGGIYYTDSILTLTDVAGVSTQVQRYDGEVEDWRRYLKVIRTWTGVTDPVDASYANTGTLTWTWNYPDAFNPALGVIAGLITLTFMGGSNTTYDGTTFTGPLDATYLRYNQTDHCYDENPPDQVDNEFTAEELLTVKIFTDVVPETDNTKLTNALAALA